MSEFEHLLALPDGSLTKTEVGILVATIRVERHRADLLAKALGDLLVATGAVIEQPLTGPQLLLFAEEATAHFGSSRHPAPDAR